MKVILNKCFGGFSVSDQAYRLYAQKKGLQLYRYCRDYDKKTKKLFYKKLNDNENSFLTEFFIKNLGDEFEYKQDYYQYKIVLNQTNREDPILIEVIEELGEKANGDCSRLKIVDIPNDMKYVVFDYDGIESLHTDMPVW